MTKVFRKMAMAKADMNSRTVEKKERTPACSSKLTLGWRGSIGGAGGGPALSLFLGGMISIFKHL
jgi:hypothetical protein